MDRQILDSLYLGRPSGAFRKALANLDEQSFSFLREHAGELDADQLIELLGKPLSGDIALRVEPFVRRLADALIALLDQPVATPGPPFSVAGVGATVRALDLAEVLDEDAWADLTMRLKGHPPKSLWYSFVDKVRGGQVFNALNEPAPNLDPKDFLCLDAQKRRAPYAVALLEDRKNDPKAVAYVLSLPANVVLRVHERVPDLVRLEDVWSVVACRATAKDERWVTPLPEWMAPYVVERLRHCEDEEALELYNWLSAQQPGSYGGDLFEMAVERFKAKPLSWAWHPLIGQHLATGKAWKTQGRTVVEFCVGFNRGFPPTLVTAAMAAATSKDGADAEKHRAAILRSMHELAARVFVERADDALKRGDWDWGGRLLSALASLDPGSFLAPAIHHLRKIANLPEDVARLIEACEELAHSGGRAPSEHAFHEAFLVLSGSLS